MKNINLAYILVFLTAFTGILTSCKNRNLEQNQPEIAVTNSYLQCVVKDLCVEQSNILCLTPPGTCPGHFDISPSQVKHLCNCRILLLFDFQKGLEDSLSRMKSKGLKTSLVDSLKGLCIPRTYFGVCQDVCNILRSEFPERETQYKRRLRLIEMRLEDVSNELHEKIKQTGLENAKVLVSHRQADFAKWLGLDVVCTFVGSDTETVSNINDCLKKAKGQDVRFVIANRQEGTGLADALAQRLGAKVAVFSNFPQADNSQNNFDRLLRENVEILLE